MADDTAFRAYVKKYGVSNPDDPRHFYDYRGAFKAGVIPQQWSSLPDADRAEDLGQIRSGERPPIPTDAYMWPDQFKLGGHPVPPKPQAGRNDMSAIPQLLAQLMGQMPPRPPYRIPPAGIRFTDAPFQSGPEALIPDEVDIYGRPMSLPNALPGQAPSEVPPMPDLPPAYATPGIGELPSPPIPATGTMGPELQAFGMRPQAPGPRPLPQGSTAVPDNAQRIQAAPGAPPESFPQTSVPQWDQMVRDARIINDDDASNRLLTIRPNNRTDANTPEGLAAMRSLALRANPQYKNALAANLGRRDADLQTELPPIPMHIKGAGEFGHSLDIDRILKSKKKRRNRQKDAFAARRAGQTIEDYRTSRNLRKRMLDDPNSMTLMMGGTLEGQAALQQTSPLFQAQYALSNFVANIPEGMDAATVTATMELLRGDVATAMTAAASDGKQQPPAGAVAPLPATPGPPPTPNIVQKIIPHLQNLTGLVDRASQNVFGGKPIQGLAGLFVDEGNVTGENVTKGSLQRTIDEASIGNQQAMRILQRLRQQGHVARYGLQEEVDAVLGAEERFATPTGPRKPRANDGDFLDKAAGFVRNHVMGGVSARR